MRLVTVVCGVLLFVSVVLVDQASAFGFRGLWQRSGYGRSTSCTCCVVTKGSQDRQMPIQTPAPATDDRSPDERRCAEMRSGWCRMVRPKYEDVDPYPACKAWKWNHEACWH